MDIACIGNPAPAQHPVGTSLAARAQRAPLPARRVGHRTQQFGGARVRQMTQPEIDRIGTGFGGQFIDHAFMRERIRQRRYATQP
ncbi:hypothetical protein D9M68_658030 [compost metagenome]